MSGRPGLSYWIRSQSVLNQVIATLPDGGPHLHPVSLNLKKDVRVHALQQNLINKPSAHPVPVFPPVIVQAKPKSV